VLHSEYFNIDFGMNVIQGSVLSPTCSILKWYLQLRVIFLARDTIYAIARYTLSPVRPFVCLSVCPTHGWISQRRLTVEVRIMQPSPQSSSIASWRVWEATTAKRMKIDPHCLHARKLLRIESTFLDYVDIIAEFLGLSPLFFSYLSPPHNPHFYS